MKDIIITETNFNELAEVGRIRISRDLFYS